MLYAQSIRDVAIACLKKFDFNICRHDSLTFSSYFHAEYYLTVLTNTAQAHKDILLDISVFSETLLSTHPLRFAKRYILKGFP